VENIWKKYEKNFVENMGKNWKKKVWGKCEKPKSGKNAKNSCWQILEKNVEKFGIEKMWINDLEEVKSVEKC
jgi:hypothetical protein